MLAGLRRGAAIALIGVVRLYQLFLSPWLGGRCRHLPSCSAYAIEALERFGPLGGGWLALKRLGRCHPWGSWGYDPVPERDGTTVGRCETAGERHC
ncbi:MAG TPA: membrane protein insertion efficiency factor YidD [Gammaproteobacteria bacterium]|nr:membrane protein insertion efficiency factor YidD [Gammaproteobacteria bacterium]